MNPAPKPMNIPAGILLTAKPTPKPNNKPAGIKIAPFSFFHFLSLFFDFSFLKNNYLF